jgi:hypothetical protein
MIAQAASYFLNFAVLLLVAWATPLKGWRLFFATLILGVGVGSFNLLIEAVAFAVIDLAEAVRSLVTQLCVSALISAAVVMAARFQPTASKPIPKFSIARVIGVIVAYQILYLIAGMLVFPFVAKFYINLNLPPLEQVLALQALRACVFIASVAMFLLAGLRHAPLVLGTAFSVIGGLAPLLPDNPLMPAEMRGYHAIEVGISNFLFGVVLAMLLTSKGVRKPTSETEAIA